MSKQGGKLLKKSNFQKDTLLKQGGRLLEKSISQYYLAEWGRSASLSTIITRSHLLLIESVRFGWLHCLTKNTVKTRWQTAEEEKLPNWCPVIAKSPCCCHSRVSFWNCSSSAGYHFLVTASVTAIWLVALFNHTLSKHGAAEEEQFSNWHPVITESPYCCHIKVSFCKLPLFSSVSAIWLVAMFNNTHCQNKVADCWKRATFKITPCHNMVTLLLLKQSVILKITLLACHLLVTAYVTAIWLVTLLNNTYCQNKVADWWRRATFKLTSYHNKVTDWSEFEKCSSSSVSHLVMTHLCQLSMAVKTRWLTGETEQYAISLWQHLSQQFGWLHCLTTHTV